MGQISGVESYETSGPDTKRVWWSDAGVHQNLTFPVHPDPITGMHCWHQMVRVERAGADDRYGDIFVDTNLSFAVYQKWKALTRPAPGPGGLRRPLWLPRVVRPQESAFYAENTATSLYTAHRAAIRLSATFVATDVTSRLRGECHV